VKGTELLQDKALALAARKAVEDRESKHDQANKNVDHGRSSRAAEDVGHCCSTKGGVEGRGNKRRWKTTTKSGKKYQGANAKATQERSRTGLRKTTATPERERGEGK
jgi:hypothetical protein